MSIIKRFWKYIIVTIIALIIGGSFGPSSSEYDNAKDENTELTGEIELLKSKNDELNDENKDLQAKVDKAAPFFKLSKKEQENQLKEAELKEAELKKQEEAKKAEEERKAEAAAAEEKRKAEEKERRGYDTGITYNQLARNPDDYVGEKVKFRGKVVQVMEGDDETQIRLAVGDNYDTILFASFDPTIVDSRVLEDDTITIMGVSAGLISYDSTMGGKISIPGIAVNKIER